MAKESVLQVRTDSELKEQAESLYKSMGSSFAEAVRIFAKQSVAEQAMPFRIFIPSGSVNTKRVFGLANGKFDIPEDIDADNDKIAEIISRDGPNGS